MVNNEKQQSNPYSTGGGGVIFETRVQAYFTILMLLGGFAPCIPNYPITKIKLQGRYIGYNTDDLIIFSTDPKTGKEAKLLAQVKHEISITERDVTFSSVIQSTWNDFKDKSFNYKTDAIALITGTLSATDINDVRPVLEWARTCESEDEFFIKINTEGFTSKAKKEKLEVFKKQLKKANNETELSNQELWTFLKAFHIIGYDLDLESGLRLSQILSQVEIYSNKPALDLWARVVDFVQTNNQSAGTLTLENLPIDITNSIEKPIKALSSSEQDISRLVQEVRLRLHDDIQSLYSKIPLWGVDHRVYLGDLFVDVNILEELSNSNKSEIDDLWRDFKIAKQMYSSSRSLDRIGLGREKKRVSGLEILSKNTNFIVVGKPGSGKTTYLQRVVTECNTDNLQVHRISDLIKLREFVEDGCEFAYSLERYFEKRWQLSNQEITLVFSQGLALVLLDGLDEIIGENGKNITKQIKKFARSYPQVQVIMTCRTQSFTAATDWKSLGFSFVEVADFNELQVRLFAEHWFKVVIQDESEGLVRSQEFLSQLFLETNKPIRDLTVTPILLSLTCAVFRHTNKFYSKRSKLYEEGLELLLEQWDKSREIERDQIYRDLSLEQKLELLGYLAVKKFEQSQYVLFNQVEIEGYIAEFLGIERLDSRGVLISIESQHGLLIERSQKIWSFSHLTFQEYFVTRQILSKFNQLPTDESMLNKLVNHVIDKQWREIFLLAVSMLDFPDILLHLMKAKIDKLLLEDKTLQGFLTWVYHKSESVDELYSPAAVRAFYFNRCGTRLLEKVDNNIYEYKDKIPILKLKGDILVDYSLEGALANTYLLNQGIQIDPEGNPNDNKSIYYSSDGLFGVLSAYHNLAIYSEALRDLVRELGEHNPHQQWECFKQWWQIKGKGWTEKLKLFMNECRNISHDWEFSEKQNEFLEQYSYTNELLLDCININSNVSEKTKQEIYDLLLLPNAEIEKRKLEIAQYHDA